MNTYEILFLQSLGITIISELVVLLLALRYLFREVHTPLYSKIAAGTIASALTLPYFWFILPAFITNFLIYAIVGEMCIWIIEGLFYHIFLHIPLWKCIVLSFLCNAGSILVGELLKML